MQQTCALAKYQVADDVQRHPVRYLRNVHGTTPAILSATVSPGYMLATEQSDESIDMSYDSVLRLTQVWRAQELRVYSPLRFDSAGFRGSDQVWCASTDA